MIEVWGGGGEPAEKEHTLDIARIVFTKIGVGVDGFL